MIVVKNRIAGRGVLSFLSVAALLGAGAFFSTLVQENRAMAAESEKQLAHIVFFTLKDSTPENRQKCVESCKKYLTKHPGEVYFAVGTLNPDLKREVNDQDYDVALHVVFKDKAAHDAYQTAERHLKFIAEGKETWKKVRVFDSDLSE